MKTASPFFGICLFFFALRRQSLHQIDERVTAVPGAVSTVKAVMIDRSILRCVDLEGQVNQFLSGEVLDRAKNRIARQISSQFSSH